MRKTSIVLLSLLSLSSYVVRAQAPTSQPSAPPVIKVLAMGHQGTSPMTPEVRQKILPQEVRETVKLYLGGKIDQWYFSKDTGSVIFVLNVTTTDEARSLLESLPLGKAHILTFDYISLSPLTPLRLLVDPQAQMVTPQKP